MGRATGQGGLLRSTVSGKRRRLSPRSGRTGTRSARRGGHRRGWGARTGHILPGGVVGLPGAPLGNPPELLNAQGDRKRRLPEELDPAGGFPLAADVPLALQQLHVVEGVFLGDPATVPHLPRGGGGGAGEDELPQEREHPALSGGQRPAHIGMLTYIYGQGKGSRGRTAAI